MNEPIESITIKYLSGRHEVVLAAKREDQMLDKPGFKLLYQNEEASSPLVRIYSNGAAYMFQDSSGIKTFENREDVKKDMFYSTLLETFEKMAKVK